MIGPNEIQPERVAHHDPLDVDTDEFTYAPGNSTLYRAIRVRMQTGKTLLCVEPTASGRSWNVFVESDGFLAWSYVQEKLDVRDGDLWAMYRFVCWLLGRPGDETSVPGERP